MTTVPVAPTAVPANVTTVERSFGVRPLPVLVGGVMLDPLTEAQVVEHVIGASVRGTGGSVITPNVDFLRQAADSAEARWLISQGSLVVPDGVPLVWTARMQGQRLPERVAGSALIHSLTAAAARSGRSVYLLGGDPGVPEAAAAALVGCHQQLVVAGCDSPPYGFDQSPESVDEVCRRLVAAAPDIVFVGLGFPKQERFITVARRWLPQAWFVGCGAALAMASGAIPRAPRWMQRTGLEWAYRLGREPRRLARRYLVRDLPFAVRLLATAAVARLELRS